MKMQIMISALEKPRLRISNWVIVALFIEWNGVVGIMHNQLVTPSGWRMNVYCEYMENVEAYV